MRTAYFVCTNYNGTAHTQVYIESLIAQFRIQDDLNLKIIIVDNASEAEERRKLIVLCQPLPQVETILSDVNLGYFRGLNLGLERISIRQDDFVIVGNNDLKFQSNFIHQLFSKKYSSNVYVIAPDLVTLDGVHQNPHYLRPASRSKKLALDLYFSHFLVSQALLKVLRLKRKIFPKNSRRTPAASGPIHMGIGACYILTPAFFRKLVKLDDSVFLYGEEALLTGQILYAGGIIYYDADLEVVHDEHASVAKLPSIFSYKHAQRSYRIGRKFT